MGTAGRSHFEQHKTDVVRSLTHLTLTGARVVDRCFSPQLNTEFALVTLDSEAFRASVAELDGLDARLQKAIRENAQKAFDEMDAIVGRPRSP